MANLEYNFTQKVECYHVLTKSAFNRHTFLVKNVERLAKDVNQMAIDLEYDINLQQRHSLQVLKLVLLIFICIRDLVMYECLQIIVPE